MVSNDIIIRLLGPRLGEFIYTRQGLKVDCPRCDDGGHKANLELNMDKLVFRCWSCNYKGYLSRLLSDYAVDNTWRDIHEFKYTASQSEVVEKALNFPVETVPFHLNKEVTRYLTVERGIPREELSRRKVRYVYSKDETYYDHICFPFYESGRLVGACLQSMSTKRYRNLGPLNFVPYMEFINPMYPVVVTEGVYDALSGANAIPQLGTEINKSILEYLEGKDVILASDNTVNMEMYLRQLKNIERHNPSSITLFDLSEHKDMNQYYMLDPEGFFDELRRCMKQGKG